MRTWAYVLEIITSLASTVAFRDALLRCEPRLLPDLVDRATCDGGLHAKYSEPAVAILSHPLPGDCPLPSSAQTLFLRLVQYATQNPCASALKPVYAVLHGTYTLLVGLLSNETLSRLEEQLGDVLRSSNAHSAPETSDQLRTLHCLAIMQMIVEAYNDRRTPSASFYETQDLLASPQPDTTSWTPENMQNFFVGTTKAPKTVQLVVLQAMWACQAHDDPFDDRMTTLFLSNHIMAAIPSDLKDAWCASNAAVVQKLQQKVLACQDAKLRLAAMALVCRLCKPVMLQSSLVESVRHASTNLALLDQLRGPELEEVLACFLPLLDRETIEGLFQRLLDALVEVSESSSRMSSKTCQTVVRSLLRLSCESTVVEDACSGVFLSGLTGSKLEELSVSLTRTSQTQHLKQSTRTCTRLPLISRHEACQEYVSLLLTLSMHVAKDEHHSIGSVMKSLVSLHALSAQGSLPYRHPRDLASRPTSRIEIAETEVVHEAAHQDWRQTLQAYGATNAHNTIHDMTKVFARACYELEARCENVERPLKEEREIRETLQEELDLLQQAYDDLEAQHLDRKLQQDGLEVESDECRRTLEAAQDENAELLSKISMLQQELEDNQDEFRRQLAAVTAVSETAELERATMSAKMQEEAEDMQERLIEYTSRLIAQDEEVQQLRSSLTGTTTVKDELKLQVEGLEKELQDKETSLQALQAARHESQAHYAQLQSDLDTTRLDLEQAEASHEREIEAMREVVRQNSEAANASHNHALDRMASQHGGEVAGLEGQVAEGLQQIKRLEKKCRQKDAQIAEANALRVQLLATLGGGEAGAGGAHMLPPDTQSQAQTPMEMSLPHRTRSSARQTMQMSRQEDSLMPFSQSFDGAMDEVDSQVFNGEAAAMQTSFTSTGDSSNSAHNAGPTPKRARPRRLVKASVPSTTVRTSKAVGRMSGRKLGLAVQDSNKRKPLGGLHVNISPRKEFGDEHRTPSKSAKMPLPSDTQDYGDTMLDD